VFNLDDKELQDHLHILDDKIIASLEGESADEIERGRDLVIDTIDRSMNVSILQYSLAAEEERNVA
jgi:hypothetical protein